MKRKHRVLIFFGALVITLFGIYLTLNYMPDNETDDSNENNEPISEETNGDSNDEEAKEGSSDQEQNGEEESSDDSNNQEENGNEENKDEVYWGVDSASNTDDNLYQCVEDEFGKPAVWGRYLGDIDEVSVGLTQEEASFLHENDVRILVIYNHITDATGYDHGVNEAEKAIEIASELEIPEGTAIFGDIEPDFPVDSAFIEGWYATLSESEYEPAIYGVFDEGSDLMEAYNSMEEESQSNTIVWTAYPQEEITTKENAPEYNPQGPENAMVYGWQYAIEADQCTIDTNLFDGQMMDYLW